MSKNKQQQLLDSVFGANKPSQVPSSAVKPSQLPTVNSEPNHGLVGENNSINQQPTESLSTTLGATTSNHTLPNSSISNQQLLDKTVALESNNITQYHTIPNGSIQYQVISRRSSINFRIKSNLSGLNLDNRLAVYEADFEAQVGQSLNIQGTMEKALDMFLKSKGF